LSGLVGYRLTLQNGANPLKSPLNGPGANGSGILFGTANRNSNYNITVRTQPTTPSQTCVVANGTGNTGNGNVTNIAVTCTINPPRFLYVANRGAGNVSGFSINAAGGALTPIPGSPFASGANPVSIAVDPTGAYAYIANQSSGSISAFTIDRTSGALVAVGGSPYGTPLNPTSVAIDPSGAFVFVTSSSGGTVSVYTITPGSGALVALAGSLTATGRSPSSVIVDPLGQFAYVANQIDGTFAALTIDPTGLLSVDMGSPFAAGASPRALALDPTGHFAQPVAKRFELVMKVTFHADPLPFGSDRSHSTRSGR